MEFWYSKWFNSVHRSCGPGRAFGRASLDTQLFKILQFAHQLKSQIPNDIVFALIAVCPLLLGGVTVDYELTAAQTYADAARAIISATKDLSVLPFACQGIKNGQDCPS